MTMVIFYGCLRNMRRCLQNLVKSLAVIDSYVNWYSRLSKTFHKAITRTPMTAKRRLTMMIIIDGNQQKS